ncbi:MAG: DUF692 domain-containing protein [Myxococcales bacterium]|nr:DUF692 domain-containing protein [Myxococcales bacterium]MCB9566996.1 DUF692 domain-containing protein [Myxococcales bacterium]MCB9570367.1 DUF692 domain-containing protein [Myxococcales bacterium]MCB9704731.1 DUF692 domain-containing protein [Myxococcales bacterium]
MLPPPPTGIGLGLRSAFMAEIDAGAADGLVAFLELSPENYLWRGGAAVDQLGRICERFPLIGHGVAMNLGGVDPLDPRFFGELRRFLDRHPTPWYSDHLCFCNRGGELHDLLPLPFTTRTATRTAARIREAQERLERPMLVENVSYYLALGESEHDEPDFIVEVIERADCGLLLDVNNAYVNAQNHGFDPLEWLARIPLERVRQLHVAGHEPWDDATLVDTHGAAVRDEVYDLMAWVVERIGPVPVLLERDNNIPPLADLLAEVKALDAVYQGALARWRASEGQEVAGG